LLYLVRSSTRDLCKALELGPHLKLSAKALMMLKAHTSVVKLNLINKQ
jgi:hypothetical protein